MIMIVVSIKDLGSQLFSRPQFVPAVGVALRSFMDEVNRVPSPQMPNDLYSHSDDFELYELATFDDTTGDFTPHERPKLIAQAKQFKQAAPGAPALVANNS